MSELLTATLFELTDGCESLKNDCVFSIAIPCPANLRGKDPNTLHFVLKMRKDLALGVGRLLRSEAAHIKRKVLDREAEPGDEDLPLAKGLYAYVHKKGPKAGHFVFVSTRVITTDAMAKRLDHLAAAWRGGDCRKGGGGGCEGRDCDTDALANSTQETSNHEYEKQAFKVRGER